LKVKVSVAFPYYRDYRSVLRNFSIPYSGSSSIIRYRTVASSPIFGSGD
jgi:hypothetical protein